MDSPFTARRSPTSPPTQLRVLCPSNKTGAVLANARHIETLTGGKIRLLDDPHLPPGDDRVLLISTSADVAPDKNESGGREKEEEGERDSGGGGGGGGGGGYYRREEGEEEWGPVRRALVRVLERVVRGEGSNGEEGRELGEDVVVSFRVLVGSNEGWSLFGRRGERVIDRIRANTGAYVRILPRDQIPPCAYPGDEVILITGNFSQVKKALLSVSSYVHDGSRADAAHYGPGLHAPEFHSRGSSPNMGPENSGDHNMMIVEEDVVFKMLCLHERVGSLIGKGGAVVKALEHETGTSIQVSGLVPNSDERVVTIFARENSEQRHSPAQDAVMRVHSRISEAAFERGAPFIARILVHSQQIGRLMGRGGQGMAEIRQATGATIRILPNEHAPRYGSPNEEVVQVTGNFQSVQNALFYITSRLREMIFPFQPPFLGPAAPPYPAPYPEMHPPHFRPRPRLDHQSSFSHGMDGRGAHNLDRGPYPHGREQLGDGTPFEGSPSSWTPQPFNNEKHREGVDVGPRGSAGGHAPESIGTSVEIVIPQRFLGHVYGENSSNLTEIKQISGANVLVHDPKPGTAEGLVIVSGTPDQIHFAQSLVHAFIFCGEAIP